MPSVFPLFNSWFPFLLRCHLFIITFITVNYFNLSTLPLLLLQFFLRCPFYFLAFISVISYWLASCSILFNFNVLICSFALNNYWLPGSFVLLDLYSLLVLPLSLFCFGYLEVLLCCDFIVTLFIWLVLGQYCGEYCELIVIILGVVYEKRGENRAEYT